MENISYLCSGNSSKQQLNIFLIMEEKYLLVVNAVNALNALGCSYKYEFIGCRMYIDGVKGDCGILLGLLWSKVNDFAFYPCDKGVEVIYFGE